MTVPDSQAWAVLKTLGLLPDPLETAATQIRDEVDEVTDAAVWHTLAYGVSPIEPSPGLLDRVWQGIRRPRFRVLPQDKQIWDPHPIEKIEVATLHFDPVSRMASALFRAQPGAFYPRHEHLAEEEVFMLSGDLALDTQVFHAGDYVRSTPTIHHSHVSQNGCLCYVRTCVDNPIVEVAAQDQSEPVSVRAPHYRWEGVGVEGVELVVFFRDAHLGTIRGLVQTHQAVQRVFPEVLQVEELLVLAGQVEIDQHTCQVGDYVQGSLPSIAAVSPGRFFFHASVAPELAA